MPSEPHLYRPPSVVFRFAQRAAAAFFARAVRSAAVIPAAVILPPLDPAVILNSMRLAGEFFLGLMVSVT